MKDILLFVPTYNAARTLPLLIDRIPSSIKEGVKEIFISDDASKDNTHLIAIGYKQQKGLNNLKIIHHDKNKGYGGNQKFAYKYAIENNFDIVVMLHGDAQYAPELIPSLLEPVEKGEADLVFGSRMKGNPIKGGMPLYKYIGNRILTAIENAVLKLNLSEYHSGYRVFDVHALKKVPFHLCSDGYHFDTDILIQFKIRGLRIKERPIPTHYGEESHSPSFKQLISYSLNIIYTLWRYILHEKGIKKTKEFEI